MPAVSEAPASIQIKNPRIIQLILEEHEYGIGRSPTETAENLISLAAEHKRLDRARGEKTATSAA